ncbi:hypothetical protein AAFG13_36840 [Bradyrhizobium sp. B124]|uniref:ORC-CDC6 family AAA ATPase n=1 Tax=Bradyrhizobium sp. B124 TaxID=3140245 RepID=UPI003183CFB6
MRRPSLTYLIFTAIARSLQAIDECRRKDILSYDAKQEMEFVETFWQQLWLNAFELGANSSKPDSLLACASLLLKMCMAVRINSLRLYTDRVVALVQGVQPVQFYRTACRILADSQLLHSRGHRFHVKVSLDDVHRFRRDDQALLNGLIELNTAPISWNLSFVSNHYDAGLSSDRDAPLSGHDVERIDLNYAKEPKAFRRLCLRLYEMRVGLPPASDDQEELRSPGYDKVLGNPNVSVLFDHLLETTSSEGFRERIYEHLDYIAALLNSAERTGSRPSRPADPRKYLYHTYIFISLFEADRNKFVSFLSSRTPKQVDNYFRQKNVAALVCASNELGRAVPYAGTNALAAMSDGCVRDFLRILACLYESARTGIHQRQSRRPPFDYFSAASATRQIPVGEQSRGFFEASRDYIEQFDVPTVRAERVLADVVNGVGEFIRLLQSRDRARALSLPERGIIRLDLTEVTLLGVKRARLSCFDGRSISVSTRELSGCTKVSSCQARARVVRTLIAFRLHRLAAPAFNISSRGPQRVVDVPLHFFLNLSSLVGFPKKIGRNE